MAKESTGDWFGFAELSDDFSPPLQPQTKDNNKETDSGKHLDTDSIKGVKKSDNTTVRSDSKSVTGVAVEIAASASTDTKTQCSVEGLAIKSGISAEQKPKDVEIKHNASKFTPPTTPSKVIGKQPSFKPSPKGVSSVESSPLNQCSVVIKKNPILDNLPRQNSYENVFAYVNNDKIEIKSDPVSEKICKERERKISSSESESSVSGLNRQTSSDKKSDLMVFNADIEVRKSGRLKSSKCSSRYRGDYGIRAEVYTKLTSKKTDNVTNESEVNIDTENIAKDVKGNTKEIKVNIGNVNVTEHIKHRTYTSEVNIDSSADVAKDIDDSTKQSVELQSVIQNEIVDQMKTKVAKNELLEQNDKSDERKIEDVDQNDLVADISKKESNDSVETKSDTECASYNGSCKNIKKVINYTGIKSKENLNQKTKNDTSNIGEAKKQGKSSVMQTRRSSGQNASQKCDQTVNKSRKENSAKLHEGEKPIVVENLESKTMDSRIFELGVEKNFTQKKQNIKSRIVQADQETEEKQIESNSKSKTISNEGTTVKQSGCDTKTNKTVNVRATQKQRIADSMTKLKPQRKNVPVKKKVVPVFRTHLTLQSGVRNDDIKQIGSSKKDKTDIITSNELGSTSCEEKRAELEYSASVTNDLGKDELKNENLTGKEEEAKQDVNKGSPLKNAEIEKRDKVTTPVLTGKDEQSNNVIEQSVACDISYIVPSQSNLSDLTSATKQNNFDGDPNIQNAQTADKDTVSSVQPTQPIESVSKTVKPLKQTVTESVNKPNKTKSSENSESPNIPVFKFYKTKEKTPEKTTDSAIKSNVSAEMSLKTSATSENTSSDSSVSLLESLRLRLFASAGVKAIEVVDKPKVFESKIKQPKVKKSQNSDKNAVIQSKAQSGSDNYLNKTYSDSESNKSSVISSKSSNRSGHSTPRSSSPSSEILDEVSRSLEDLQKVKQKRDKPFIQKPKKPRFSQKMFMLRSMIPKQTESDSESHSSVTAETSDDTVKVKDSGKKEIKSILETSVKKKIDLPSVAKEADGPVSKPNARSFEKVNESNKSKTLKTTKELDKKQPPKPKSIKCHACAHIFKNKDLLKKHYPCLMRQTRKWSQNKLRPNRVFRYVDRPPKEQGSKKFICLLPKSRKQEQERPRPQLFTYGKTKFKRVKGKRRRRLYNILQELAGKRQPKTYPHLHVDYENLTSKSQFLYNLGLFDPETVDHSHLRDYYSLQKGSIHADSDQTDKENRYKLFSREMKQDLNTSQESMLSLTETYSDLQNAEKEFESSQLSDFIDGKQESSSSETEAPPVLERFGTHNTMELISEKDSASDSDSNGPPLLELQFDSPTKKTQKERHFLDFVENIVRKDDTVKEDQSDLNSAEFKISMKNIAKLKDAGNKAGGTIQRHFTDFIDIQDIKSPGAEGRPVLNDNILWEQSEKGEMTLAEIKEILKPKSRKENAFSKATLLNLRSDLAKLLSDVKTPVKKDANAQLPEKREPSEEKTDIDKLGIDFSAYERKSLFETLENVDASSFERQVSQEDCGGSYARSEMSPEPEHPDPYKSSSEYEQDLLPATYGESDSLDTTSKGGITDNILQMLNTLEDKGSVAENMSNLLQILAENLGIIKTSQEETAHGRPEIQEEEEALPSVSSQPDLMSTASDMHLDRTEFFNMKEDLSVISSNDIDNRKSVTEKDLCKSPESVSAIELKPSSEIIHGKVPDIIVSDNAVELKSEISGHGTTDSIPQQGQGNKGTGMKESNLFKSITELNSIETDSDSNLGDSYDADSMSKRLAELKATNYDASASDINSDMLSDSETVSSEKSKDYDLTADFSESGTNKIERPVLCVSPTARRYDSDILESEEEPVITLEERPRLIMKIKLPAGASFDKSDDSSQKDSSSSTSASAKSSDVSDIEDGKSEDETLVEGQSMIENNLNNTITVEENGSIGIDEDIFQKNVIKNHKNEDQPFNVTVEAADGADTEIQAEHIEEINIPRPEISNNLIANLETVPTFKSDVDIICDNEIMFPKKLKLNTALTIGDSFDYESDSTSSFEREVTVVPRVGMSPKALGHNDVPVPYIELNSGKQDNNEKGEYKNSMHDEKVLSPKLKESPVTVERDEAIQNIHNELHDADLPLADNDSLHDPVEIDSLNESQVIENILDMETQIAIQENEEIQCHAADSEINEKIVLNSGEQSDVHTGINIDAATDMLCENKNSQVTDNLSRNLTNTDTSINTGCKNASLVDLAKLSQEIPRNDAQIVHSDGTQNVPDTAFYNVCDISNASIKDSNDMLTGNENSVVVEVTCIDQMAQKDKIMAPSLESMSNHLDDKILQNTKENKYLEANTLGPADTDIQMSSLQSLTDGDQKGNEASGESLKINSNTIKTIDNQEATVPNSLSYSTKKNPENIVHSAECLNNDPDSSENISCSTAEINSKIKKTCKSDEGSKNHEQKIHISKSKSNSNKILPKSEVKSSRRQKTSGRASGERVEHEREISLSNKRSNKKNKNTIKQSVQKSNSRSSTHKMEVTEKPSVKIANTKSSANKIEHSLPKANVKLSKEKLVTVKPASENTEIDIVKIHSKQLSKEIMPVTVNPVLKNTEIDKISTQSDLPSQKIKLKKTEIDKDSIQSKQPSKEIMPVTVKPVLKNTKIDEISTQSDLPSQKIKLKKTEIDKDSIQSKKPSKEIMPVTVKSVLKNTEIDEISTQSVLPSQKIKLKKTEIDKDSIQSKQPSKEIMPVTVKPVLKNTEIDEISIQSKQAKVQDKDSALQNVSDNISSELGADSDLNNGNVANIPIPPVIADEKDTTQVKSILKGSGVSDGNNKEEQNKKRRISYTDYLSRVKKGDNTKTNDDRKQAKVPFTLRDENKSIFETKLEPGPENVKSPEIVIDENMYETQQASANWHSFANIKKPQERAPALKKLQRNNSTKKPESILPTFMPLPVPSDDSVHELDLYDKEKSNVEYDSKRYVSMPLTKKSDILTLENTLHSSSSGAQLIVSDTKNSDKRSSEQEPVEQDDVLSVFDSLFSLGETVLNLNKSLPKSSADVAPQEEGNLFTALDTLCKVGEDLITSNKSENKPASDSAVRKTSIKTDSVSSKGVQGNSKHHPSDVIDLTDEPERYHRNFFLELSPWVLQAGSAENIKPVENSGEPKGNQERQFASYSDPGYYFGKMGSFSGIYLSRFRYNISVFEAECKNLGNKIIIEKEASPLKSNPIESKMNPVEIVGKTDTYPAVENEQESSFEQDSIEVTEACNEDYMDDDYADMLAAAQLALNEEAQNQNVSQEDNEDIGRNIEIMFDKNDEVESKTEEAENDYILKNKKETSTGEAVEILNSLVKTLSADIETCTSDAQTTEYAKETLTKNNEIVTTKTKDIKESVNDISSEQHVDELIDNVSKFAEEVLMTTTESVPHEERENENFKYEEKKHDSNENVQIDQDNMEEINVEDSMKLAETALIDGVEEISTENKPTLLESPQMPDSEETQKLNKESKTISPKNEMDTTTLTAEKDSSLISSVDIAGQTEVSESKIDEAYYTEDSNNATQLQKSRHTSVEKVESEIALREKQETEETFNNIILPHSEKNVKNKNDIIDTVGTDSFEIEISAKDADGHLFDNEKNEKEITGNICTEIENEERRSDVVVGVKDKVISDDITEIKVTETELITSESNKSLIISDSIVSLEKGETFSLSCSEVTEENKFSDEPENAETKEILKAEKITDRPSYTEQNSLVSMDYDTVSDGSFSEGEIRKSDSKKSLYKAKSSDRDSGRKSTSVSKDSDDVFHRRSSYERRNSGAPESSRRLEKKQDKERSKLPEAEQRESSKAIHKKSRERKRSDSWDAASYRVEHEETKKEKKRRQTEYDTEDDDYMERREKKKKRSQASEVVLPRHFQYDKQEKEDRKFRQSPEAFDYGIPTESKKYRKGKEFVSEDHEYQYYKTYRKGKKFVDEDNEYGYYKRNRKNRANRNRTDSLDDRKSKNYEDNEHVKKRERRKESSEDRKFRDYSEERKEKESFDARVYRVEKHRKKDRKRREMLESDAEEYYTDDNTKLKSRKSKKHAKDDNKNYNVEYESVEKNNRKNVKGIESVDDEHFKTEKQSRKNWDTRNVSEDRSRKSNEAGELESKDKARENRKDRQVLQDAGAHDLEQKTKDKGDRKPSEDRANKQPIETKDFEFENETMETRKSNKPIQGDENPCNEKCKVAEHREPSENRTEKSVEAKKSELENNTKQIYKNSKSLECDDENGERKLTKDKVTEYRKPSEDEIRKSDKAIDVECKFEGQKNKSIKVVSGDEDDSIERKREKKKDRENRKHSEDRKIENSAEAREHDSQVEKKIKSKNIIDSEKEKYEKERNKEKGRGSRKPSEDRKSSHSTEATELEQKNRFEQIRKSRKVTSSDDEEYYEKKMGKERRKSNSKSRNTAEVKEAESENEGKEIRKSSNNVLSVDDEYSDRKRKKQKDRESRMPSEDQRRKSQIKEIETNYDKERKSSEDLDYEDVEYHEKDKENRKNKKLHDHKKIEKETKEEKIRKSRNVSESEDDYNETKKKKKKEKMKVKAHKINKNREMSESEEEYESKKLKKKEKWKEREEKMSKHKEVSESEEEYQSKKLKKKEKWKDWEEKMSKHREVSESEEEEYQRRKKKKKEKQKASDKTSEAKESDTVFKSVKKKDRKSSKYVESDDEYYESKKVKDKHAKGSKHRDAKYYEDDESETETKHRKNKKSLAEEEYETDKLRKKDRKRMKSSESKDYDYIVDEKDKKKHRKMRESSENKDYDFAMEKTGKRDRKHKEIEMEDYEDYALVKSKKKDSKRRNSIESDNERDNRKEERRKRKVSIVDDDDDDYRKEKKKKKEKKRRKSADSEDLQYYEQKKEKVKGTKHRKSSEKLDDFDDYENEKKRPKKRSHSDDSRGELSPEHPHSSKKGKKLLSAVNVGKSDRYDKDTGKWADSEAKVDKYDRDEYRSDRDKFRSERDFDKYDRGRLQRGDLRFALKSKKMSR